MMPIALSAQVEAMRSELVTLVAYQMPGIADVES
jgi:hypothetical protein